MSPTPPNWTGQEPCAGLWHLYHNPDESDLPPHEREKPAERRMREAYATALCRSCPLLGECAEWGILHERWGTWGGLTEDDRVAWRRLHHIRVVTPESVDSPTKQIIRARAEANVT